MIAKTDDMLPILFFDGVCNLCNFSVQFILKWEQKPWLRFAALQSETAAPFLEQLSKIRTTPGQIPGDSFQSVLLVEHDRIYMESDAVLRITRYLRYPWPLLYGFILVPRPIRNRIYRVVARNRYRWFGTQAQCMVPKPEWNHRFL